MKGKWIRTIALLALVVMVVAVAEVGARVEDPLMPGPATARDVGATHMGLLPRQILDPVEPNAVTVPALTQTTEDDVVSRARYYVSINTRWQYGYEGQLTWWESSKSQPSTARV